MPQEAQQGWVPTEDPAVRQFWVLVNCDDITESNMPLEGVTAWSAFRLKTQAMIHSSWDAYIFVRCGDAATAGFMRFYFAKPATSFELGGRSHTSEQPLPPSQFVLGAVVATRTKVVPAGTAAETDPDVLSSQVTPLNGVVSRLNSSVVLSYDGTPVYSWLFDEKTGKGFRATEQAVAAGTEGSTEIAADGEFSEVRPVNAFWSIKTTKKVTTLSATPRTYTKTERSPIVWPAVLHSYQQMAVLDQGQEYWHKRFNYMLRAPYAGDVQVAYREWWQKAEPAPVTAIEMQPTSVLIKREWSEDISIPECLHPALVISEPIIAGEYPFTTYNDFLCNAIYSVAATTPEDWPDEVVKLDIEPYMGGFFCTQRTVQKPQSVMQGIVIELPPWVSETYRFENYAA